MKVILARHGNTFAPGDKVVWTGKSNDLPLVEKGLQQASNIAQWLRAQGHAPVKIYSSNLSRVRVTADIIIKELGLSIDPIVDERLAEIDYGSWTGVSDAEVEEQFGTEALQNWRERSQFPPAGQWGESEAEVTSRVDDFFNTEIKPQLSSNGKSLMIISSNGILRYFLRQIDGEFEGRVASQQFAVKTGAICVLDYSNGKLTVESWNLRP